MAVVVPRIRPGVTACIAALAGPDPIAPNMRDAPTSVNASHCCSTIGNSTATGIRGMVT